ncbi:unnamed protein product [Peronospora belbahrii]|uniref:Uncharacterized protein n=1 Tax=Peronospora belbahrii TaxID=622444 RepID=A0AAU9L922_9STRA|nr:unnamed protein product [Peronospora belbahrii]
MSTVLLDARECPRSPPRLFLRDNLYYEGSRLLCTLLYVLITVKAVYLIGMGTGCMELEESQYCTPLSIHHTTYEFTIQLLTEFVPSALLLIHAPGQGFVILSPTYSLVTMSVSATLTGGSCCTRNQRDKLSAPNYAYAPIRGITPRQPCQEDVIPMLTGHTNEHTGRLAAQCRPLQQSSDHAALAELSCLTALVKVRLPVQVLRRV